LARIDTELERIGSDSDTDPIRLAAVESFARRAVTIVENRVLELRERQAGLREDNSDLLVELESLRSEHVSRSGAVARARSRISELDILLTELRLHREAVVEAIRHDADSEEEAAMAAPRPELAESTDPEELLESKIAQLSRLGPINPLAAREFAELDERHSFLTDQMADIETSRAELGKVISSLELVIEERFQAAFGEVVNAYDQYFSVLFPGGRGRIRLVDPEDKESGVAIDAQPHGKKVSQMTLLSGGERSLAALAFLFAVFEARPSPFYVLDEVEAALDDSNLRRFLRIIDEFRKRAQLIVITHQQQTMEAADVLYGVTMEPGGSSKAIRKDMSAVVVTHVA
jgi:chromosome segregation protein